MLKNNKIVIGKILSTHNLDGNVKLLSFTEEPEDIFNYKLYDKNDRQMNCKKIGITSKKDVFLAKFDGIDGIDEARKYRNVELFVNRGDLEDVDDGEVYINDLMGMKVDGDGKTGVVENMYNYGAGDVMEVRWDKNKKLESIPFNNEYVKEVKDGVVYINLPTYV